MEPTISQKLNDLKWGLAINLDKEKKKLEIEAIQNALEHTEGNKNQASKLLRLHRTTLVMRMKKYGLL